jgi:hypothetical protein
VGYASHFHFHGCFELTWHWLAALGCGSGGLVWWLGQRVEVVVVAHQTSFLQYGPLGH